MQISYYVGQCFAASEEKQNTHYFIIYNNMEIILTRSFENVYAEVIAMAIVL